MVRLAFFGVDACHLQAQFRSRFPRLECPVLHIQAVGGQAGRQQVLCNRAAAVEKQNK
jgi:hypothetical protein